MAPASHESSCTADALGRPILLNEKFKVHSYDGGCFKSKSTYDVKNALLPILEPFHCSGSGNRFNLVLKCPDVFTLTHFYISGPGHRCTEPIKSGLVWVLDSLPDVEQSKKYDHLTSEELCEIVKGFCPMSAADEGSDLPDPCVYFTTDATTREAEVELPKWREGKYIMVKFLDTHKDQVNIDVAIIGLVGYWGKHGKQQVPLGPWAHRVVRQAWVHANPLKSMFSSSGWVCDGRDFTGGCRSGQTDFHQTSVYTVTFRCATSGFDLCEACAYAPTLGKVTAATVQADIDALANPASCKLAATRIRNLWRRNWLDALPKYFAHGLLDTLIQTLHKCAEGNAGVRPDDERIVLQRSALQANAAESQKRAEHWEEGRIIHLATATDADSTELSRASGSMVAAESEGMLQEGGAAATSVSVAWRDGITPVPVSTKNVWKVIGDEEVMSATTQLYMEVCKGADCEMGSIEKCLAKGADLMACNGDGNAVLLGAVQAGCSVEVITKLLEWGGCPDVSGKDGMTPLMYVARMQQQDSSAHWAAIHQILLQYGATEVPEPSHVLEELRATFGTKMLSALLTQQPASALPGEVLEVIYLLVQELPLKVMKQALEPTEFRALVALLQHFVSGADSLSTAYLGCRIMRAIYERGDAALQHLVRSHGASRWACRLAATKDVSQCGLHRAPHHDRISQEELRRQALGLAEVLDSSATDDSTDWRVNAKLAEIVDAFEASTDSIHHEKNAKDAVVSFFDLLKKSEKCSLNEERCTAYELERSNTPGLIRRFLQQGAATADSCQQPAMNEERWAFFKDIFGEQSKQTRKGLVRLVRALHAVIETGEALPVWRHKKEKGLKALTEAVQLKLRLLPNALASPALPESMSPQTTVMVEPLAQLRALTKYLLCITPVTDASYLAKCFHLVGSTLRETSSGEAVSVVAFELLHSDVPLPIHTLQRQSSGETQRVLLSVLPHQTISKSSATVPMLDLQVALCRLHALAGHLGYGSLLDELIASLQDQQQKQTEQRLPKQDGKVQEVWQQALALASTHVPDALAVIVAARARTLELSVGSVESPACDVTSDVIDPTMRVHTVMIAVSDEIPFALFWPMVREDILTAVREVYPHGVPAALEVSVQAGVAQNGMGPIAQKLTLEEAEMLAARVSHVVQTAVIVDRAAAQLAQDAQRAAANTSANAETILVGKRVQFSLKSGKEWKPAIVLGRHSAGNSALGVRFDIIDDHGVLWERLPRSRLRIPASRGEVLGGMPGAAMRTVLSHRDLFRIREHLRRRQEELNERRSAEVPAAVTSQLAPTEGPSSSLGIESRAAPPAEETAGHGDSTMERSASDPPAFGVVRFIEDFAEEDDAEERPGEDGEEDEEDFDEGRDDCEEEEDEEMPPFASGEPEELNGDLAPPPLTHRVGVGLGRRGMDEVHHEDLRIMEQQLHAVEQIIMAEVLHSRDAVRSRRISEGFLSGPNTMPLTVPGFRMGGISDVRVETSPVRPVAAQGASSSQSSHACAAEPVRGDFPSFVRAADLPNPTSSLDHPVVERLGCDDLVGKPSNNDPMDLDTEDRGCLPKLLAGLCLSPPSDLQNSQLKPVVFPPSWNLMQVFQHLHCSTSSTSSSKDTHKVTLDGWSLAYTLMPAGGPEGTDEVHVKASPREAAMEIDSCGGVTLLVSGSAVDSPNSSCDHDAALEPASKRRRTLPAESDAACTRSSLSSAASAPSQAFGPHEVVGTCDESQAVNDALDLLHLLRSHGPGLGSEPSMWVASKLDRKLRHQLEDPLSVVSGTLPRWATTLPRLCPFLFSLKTRKMLLKYTAYGPSFGVHWAQESKLGPFLRRRATVQTELNAQADPRKIQELSQELSNIEEHVVKSSFWLGTLQTTLVKMQKGEGLLRQSEVAMDLVATGGRLLEVQFDGENGFGSAVTQSFYVEVARDLTDRETNSKVPLWLADDQSGPGFLTNRRGLTIQPLAEGPVKEQAVRRFRFLGKVMGHALREGFVVPLPLAEDFFALVLGESLTTSSFPRPGSGSSGELCGVLADFVAELSVASAQLTNLSQEEQKAWRAEQAARSDFSERFLSFDGMDNQAIKGMSFTQYVEAGCACFLATGTGGDPLVPNGENMPITIDNISDFVELAAQFWFRQGVAAQVEAFRAGINAVFPFGYLATFSRSELKELFCGEDRIEWDEQALLQHLHPVGGLTDKSAVYKYLVAELVDMSQTDRSRFLDFVSSCPRLPPGGMAKFHVDVFPDATSKQGFPRSRACANQLYLPPYCSRADLHEKLHEAMHSSFGHHEQRAHD